MRAGESRLRDGHVLPFHSDARGVGQFAAVCDPVLHSIGSVRAPVLIARHNAWVEGFLPSFTQGRAQLVRGRTTHARRRECSATGGRRTRAALLRRALALFGLALVAATWRLWTPQHVFPQVPFFTRSTACRPGANGSARRQ